MLSLAGYSVRFKTPNGVVAAAADIDLRVEAGQTLAVVGESGSGKSQTFNGVFGLLARNGQASGRAALAGRDLLGLSPRALDAVRGRDMAMVFQDPMTALNPAMTVRRQLREVLEVHRGMRGAAAEAAALAMLGQVGIPEGPRRLSQYPHELSGGMRQRVVIAMALLCRPKLIVADEPTTALDVTIQAQILDLFRALTAGDTALVLITHDLGVVAGIATRVAVMYAGRVVEEADVFGLFDAPAHPYTAALLASIPRLDRAAADIRPIPGRPPNLLDLPPGCPFHPRCRHAAARCLAERPPLAPVGPDRRAACWFPFAGVGAAAGLSPRTPSGNEFPDPASLLSTMAAELRPTAVVDHQTWIEGDDDRPFLRAGGARSSAEAAVPAAKLLATAAATAAPILQVEHLATRFRVRGRHVFARGATLRAVEDVSFDLGDGETLGLVGESGSGKSTLGRSILRLVEPAEGRVLWRGEDMLRLPPKDLRRARTGLSMIFQDPLASLDPRMTLGAIVAEPLRIAEPSLAPAERRRRVGAALEAVGLGPEMAGRYPHAFSGGQAQRIAIARAIVTRPRLIVCDEPVSALDVSIQAQIVQLLLRLQAELSLSLLFISHDLSVMRLVSDRILVLYLGRVVEIGPRQAVFEHPAHPYTRALLAAAPIPDPRAARARPAALVRGDPPSPIDPPSGCAFRTRCPIAVPACAQTVPPLLAVSPGHGGACLFAGAEAEHRLARLAG